jgi:hypothetical protein
MNCFIIDKHIPSPHFDELFLLKWMVRVAYCLCSEIERRGAGSGGRGFAWLTWDALILIIKEEHIVLVNSCLPAYHNCLSLIVDLRKEALIG